MTLNLPSSLSPLLAVLQTTNTEEQLFYSVKTACQQLLHQRHPLVEAHPSIAPRPQHAKSLLEATGHHLQAAELLVVVSPGLHGTSMAFRPN